MLFRMWISFKSCVFVSVFGLWWPDMRGGVNVGDQGEGGCDSSIPGRGGVR